MTGFGSASVDSPHGRVVAEVRTVNARSLDVRTRTSDELCESTMWVEQAVRRVLRRGRCEVVLRHEPSADDFALLDRPRVLATFRAQSAVATELGLEAPTLATLAATPGLFAHKPPNLEQTRAAMERALGDALAALDADRAREGAALSAELGSRARTIHAAVARVRARQHVPVESHRARLADRIARAKVELDPQRLEAEIVLFVDRCDISEELSRLATHLAHFVECLALPSGADADPKGGGRKLDFLLQEMGREATTLSAKAQDADISRDVVEIKVELERMREQVQNVE